MVNTGRAHHPWRMPNDASSQRVLFGQFNHCAPSFAVYYRATGKSGRRRRMVVSLAKKTTSDLESRLLIERNEWGEKNTDEEEWAQVGERSPLRSATCRSLSEARMREEETCLFLIEIIQSFFTTELDKCSLDS